MVKIILGLILVAINVLLAYWMYDIGNYKTAMFNSFVAGFMSYVLLTELVNYGY